MILDNAREFLSGKVSNNALPIDSYTHERKSNFVGLDPEL